MERTAASIFINLAQILIIFLPVVNGQCTPNHLSHTTNKIVPSGQGMQAILPNYQFLCPGLVTEIKLQVRGPLLSQCDLQIWRPLTNGSYVIRWSTRTKAVIESNFSRDENTLTYRDQNGVPVMRGDVLGFFLEYSDNPIEVPFSTTSDSLLSTLHYVETDRPLCNMSLCESGNSVRNMSRVFVVAEFEMRNIDNKTSFSKAEETLKSSEINQGCSTSVFSTCSIQPSALVPIMPQTSTSVKPTILPTPTPQIKPPRLNPPRSERVTELAAVDESASFTVTVSTSAIVFIVIGGILFITLIVLVFVLVACVCTKKKSNQPSKKRSQPDEALATESRSTVSTQLAVSSSVEQSNNSSATGAPQPFRYVTSHLYANAEVTRDGVFNSFAPLYQNGTHSQASGGDNSLTRRARVWSTGALHTRPQVNDRHQRAHSVTTRISHNVSSPPPTQSKVSILSDPSSKRIINRYSIEVSSDYSVPKPVAVISRQNRTIVDDLEHDYSDPDEVSLGYDRLVNKFRYDKLAPRPYEEAHLKPDWGGAGHHVSPPPLPPPHHPSPPQLPPHNHLSPPKFAPHNRSSPHLPLTHHLSPPRMPPPHHLSSPQLPIHHSSPPPLPPKLDDSSPASHSTVSVVPQPQAGDSNEEEAGVNCLYTFVPTDEQRRLLKLQDGGHYEIAEDIEDNFTLAYDHLNFFKESDTYWAPATTASRLYEQLYENKYREIPRSQIRLMKRIGSGHFGTVSKGVWYGGAGSEPEEVAIKTVKNTTELERIKLLQEAAIMGQFAHVNVVRLHGVVTVGEPVLIILEYMSRGDLRSFLQKLHPKNSKRDLPDILPKLFVKFSKDIASGMSYLSKKNFIHRDLAARNILLTSDMTCKIGDFGMARDIEGESDYYKSHGGIIPVKWTAPEALNYNKYSSASDVWSYGMVLFEIWSLGEKPFNDLTNPIVIALVSSKHCQPPPPGCPRPIYHLMVECWNPDHNHRPTFDSIHDYLDSPEDSLLQWQPSDMIEGKQAHILGAPLMEANNLYLNLQRTYQKPLL